ncbi:MAG TPA: Ig-like domain-containing protein [Pseudacidobacterium sp.]|nr:Ig-like domain-containing protein [Pseudacidobacterium sp.]
MSLQSRITFRKFPTAIIFVLALLLVLPQGHSQTAATRTSLSVAKDGAKATLSVTVKDATGTAVSGGTVSFLSGNASLGSAFVSEAGTATLTLDSLPANTKQITAVYAGDSSHAASASGSANVQAEDTTLPDFSISASPTSLSLNPGDYAPVVITITPSATFTQSVTLTISGLPNGSTATFTPQIVTPVNGAAATSTLQIQTSGASGAKNTGHPFGGNASRIAYALALPGLLALMRRRTGLRLLGMTLLLIASTSGLTACSQRYGYLHHPPAANPGTPAGSYTVTVTAYSNNGGQVTSHNLQLALTVK